MSNSCTKRLMQELQELVSDPSPEFKAEPLESDILEWHFSLRGPPNSCYEGGRYHGRLLFPKDYPFKPPNIVFLTPNGRFQVGKKICLSITGYHPESWRPAWGIRTALTAIISFMLTPGEGSVGAVEWSEEARRISAKESLDWSCSVCGIHNRTVLPSESEVPSQVLKGEQELTLTLPKAEQQSGPTSSSLSKESTDDIDTADVDADGKVGDSAAADATAAKVGDVSHPAASSSGGTANYRSLPTTTTNEPEPGISAPILTQQLPPSPLPPPASSMPLLARQQSQHHDLVWKLDSLILLIIGIIIAWIGYRYLEK